MPRLLPPIAAALVLACASAGLAAACGNELEALPETSDSGNEAGSVERTACPSPSDEPADGSECLLPEGTTCDFGQCGTRLATCTRGAWKVAGNAPPSPACPEAPPNTDMPCPACWKKGATCTYGSTNCSDEDASLNTAVASCPSGTTWVVDIRPCRDGGEPDVQGDGGPDAD